MERNNIDAAERIMREKRCRIHSFFASGIAQYAVKKDQLSISPSFRSIKELCDWVVLHQNAIGMKDPE
jgi:hypothetical protein